MTDLLGIGEVRKNSEEVRNASGELLGDLKGKKKSGRTGLSFPSKAGKSGGLLFPHKVPGKTPVGLLREQAKRLENEIVFAESLAAAARDIAAPLGEAFWQAHRHLEQLFQPRVPGPAASAVRKAAYDARMNAGYQWHPHRKAAAEAASWAKALRDELKAVNAEIDQ